MTLNQKPLVICAIKAFRTHLVPTAAAAASTLLVPDSAQASLAPKDPPAFSVVQGFGAGYGPTVTRIGLWSWEFGLLNAGTNMSSFGAAYTFRDGPIFSAIGLVAFNALMLGPTSPGVFGAMGLEQQLFWGLFARMELNAEVSFDGSAQASTALLIGWGYW
jgi:hypothetical protein